MDHTLQVPLFPLGLVLFPQQSLPLRLFEPRYLTMIGDCMRTASPFGVVMITEGRDANAKSVFCKTGTLALIEDFDQLDDGMLGVSCRGTERFDVLDFWRQDDQLAVANIAMRDVEQEVQLPDEFSAMVEFVKELCHREELKQWVEGISPDWHSGEWISCRLSELLPLSGDSRQALLEMSTSERLSQLAKVMLENRMIKR